MTFPWSKTDQLNKSVLLVFLETGIPICPVFLPQQIFKDKILLHFDFNLLMRYQFSTVLAKCFRFSNVGDGRIIGHSTLVLMQQQRL